MALSKHEVMAGQFVANAMTWMHGEDITYGGTAYTAIVEREPLERIGPGGVFRYPLEILVRRSDIATVSLGTTVTCRKFISDSSLSTYKVAEILPEQAGGIWRLGLQG